MKKYFVTVSTVYEIEAESPEKAKEYLYTNAWPQPLLTSFISNVVQAAVPLAIS
jgi:hypothetical protein